jgi:CelD/BcsL family acetyltransferase involved in cellulose biosynthesis
MLGQIEQVQAVPGILVHDIYDTFADVASIKGEWNDLAGRVGDLFCSYEWCQTWWEHYGYGRRLEIHTLRDGNRLVAVLPLVRQRLGWSGARLRIVRLAVCDHTVDGPGLAIDPAYAAGFLPLVLDRLDERGPWDIVQFGPLRSYVSVTEQVAEAAAGHKDIQAVLLGRQDNWLTVFDLPATYEAYLQGLPGKDRRELLRCERNLQTGHTTRLHVAGTGQEVKEGIRALVRAHQSLWTGKGQRGQFCDWPGSEAFHTAAALRLAPTGRLSLVTIQVDDEVVGVTYGYRFGSRLHELIRGQRNDGPWRAYGLGRLLHCYGIRNAMRDGITGVDNGRGVFEYKLKLGGRLEGERSVTLLRRGWQSRLRFWLGLRTAYLAHVLYGRLWFDILAPRLGWTRPLRPFYIRCSFLAQMFRRTRFRLFGGPKVQELSHVAPPARPPGT